MSVTERLQKPGQFTVRLRAGALASLGYQVEKFDHIVITPNRLNPIGAFSDANVLDAAMYTGVITAKPDVDQFVGHGLAFWLGTDEGLGDLLDAKVSNTAGTLSTWVSSLRPASLGAGTVTNTGNTLTYDYQYVSRREAMDHMCRAVGANWRINPDFTLDAAAPATLFTNYTTPKAVITRKPEGSEGATTGIQGVDIVRGTDVLGYTTKVIVIGKTGDGAAVATGSATQATSYKDGLNGSVVMERFVNAPAEPAANVAAYAQSVLNLFSATQRQSVKLTSSTYAASLRVKVGDRVYVYDQRAGLTDSANQLTWRGELITPVILRCKAITWPILRGYGVYARRTGATSTYIDLSDWVEYEGTKDAPGLTEWEVGTSSADVDQDPEQLGPAYLGTNGDILNRLAGSQWQDYTPTDTNITVGNGTRTASYRISADGTVDYTWRLVFGSTTALTGAAQIGLPISASGNQVAVAHYLDQGSRHYVGCCAMSGTLGALIQTESGTGLVSSTAPFTWANTDTITVSGTIKP